MKKSAGSSIVAVLLFGACVAIAAISGARFSPADPQIAAWYDALDKASFTPPNAAFPIAWTTLYVLMAISAFLVWRAESSIARTVALTLWFVQLALNAAWTPIFFGARQPSLALVDLVALLVVLLACVSYTRRVSRTAAWLLAPYVAWILFAGALNEEVVRLN